MEMNLEIMRNIDEHYVMPTYGRSPVLLPVPTVAMPASYFSREAHRFSQRHNPASWTMLLRKLER